ncbi:MAG: hypothetical protein JWP44_3293 [Mucilaginibacter sp.]|nr:hypothetical protein [Mucilaginibacter sp.]
MDPFNSRFIQKEKRWAWIDYDKGISIILIGYGHCYLLLGGHGLALDRYPFFHYIDLFMYGFRMPLFFIVSGLLIAKSLNKRGLAAYIGHRNNNILYPLLIWGFIQLTLQIIANRFTHNGYTAVDYFSLIINPRRTGVFWYLNALYFIGAIYALLKTYLKLSVVWQVILGVFLYVVSTYMHVIKAGLFTDIFEYYIFFSLGDLLANIMMNDKKMQQFTSWKIFFPLLFSFLVIQYYCTKINMLPSDFEMRNVEISKPFLFLIEALVGCALSFNVSFFLQKFYVLGFLRIVGYHSLFIYCVQIIAMFVARTFLMNILHLTSVPALILLVWTSGIVLPIFFYNFCLRYGLWWLYTYKKPERQIDYIRKAHLFSFAKKRKVNLIDSNESLQQFDI